MTAMVMEPEFATTGLGWAVLDPNRISQLLATTDHGRHWYFAGGSPTEDILVDAAYDDGTIYLLADDGTVWSSSDLGATWTGIDIAPGRLSFRFAIRDGSIAIATSTGLVVGPFENPGATVVLAEDEDFVAATIDEQGWATGATAAGTMLRSLAGDSPETLLPLPTGTIVTTLANVAGVLVVGTEAGLYVYQPEATGWVECGRLPVTDATARYANNVVNLQAVPTGRWLAATGEEAVFISDDQCASWKLHSPGDPMAPEYGGIGNARFPSEAFRGLASDGDHLVVAGFNGVAASTDAGNSWSFPKVVPADYIRALHFSPRWPADRRLFVGEYGGAIAWTDDGGTSWSGSGVGILDPHTYDVAPGGDAAKPDQVFSASLELYRSETRGETWARITAPSERVTSLSVTGTRVWIFGQDTTDGVTGQLAWSDDGGNNFTQSPDLYRKIDTRVPHYLDVAPTADGTLVLMGTDAAPSAVISKDDGVTWATVFSEDDTTKLGCGVSLWPPEMATRMVYCSSSAGVQLSDDGGLTWTTPSAPPLSTPYELAGADDGTLFLATRSAELYRSTDGGSSWQLIHEAFPQAIHKIAVAPSFATTQTAALGTTAGVYVTEDAGETWVLLRRYERYEEDSYHLNCLASIGGELCPQYENIDHGCGGGFQMQVQDTMAFAFVGDSFVVNGAGPSDGSIRVVVNDADLGVFTADGNPIVVTLPGDVAGWKDVVLTAENTGVDGFHVDVIETYGPGEAMGFPWDTGSPDDTAAGGDSGNQESGTNPEDECECATASPGGVAAAAWGAVLLIQQRRRRPEGGRAATAPVSARRTR